MGSHKLRYLVRDDEDDDLHQTTTKCPECGRTVNIEEDVCPECGAQIDYTTDQEEEDDVLEQDEDDMGLDFSDSPDERDDDYFEESEDDYDEDHGGSYMERLWNGR